MKGSHSLSLTPGHLCHGSSGCGPGRSASPPPTSPCCSRKIHKVLRGWGTASPGTHYRDPGPQVSGRERQRVIPTASQSGVFPPHLGHEQPQETGFTSPPGTSLYRYAYEMQTCAQSCPYPGACNAQCYISSVRFSFSPPFIANAGCDPQK